MLRYIIRRLRGDNTLWKHLNERIDGLENEVRALRQSNDEAKARLAQIQQICERYEANQALINLGLLNIIEQLQKEKSSEAVQKQLRQMLESKPFKQ